MGGCSSKSATDVGEHPYRRSNNNIQNPSGNVVNVAAVSSGGFNNRPTNTRGSGNLTSSGGTAYKPPARPTSGTYQPPLALTNSNEELPKAKDTRTKKPKPKTGFVPFVPESHSQEYTITKPAAPAKTSKSPEQKNNNDRAPRLLRTRDPRLSVDPRLEQSVRTIQLGFDEVYFQGEQLGYGAFATVFAAKHIESKTDYAVKKIDREKMNWGDRDSLEDEIKNLTLVRDGPNIVQLFEVYNEGKFSYLVMEWLKGGELFERIVAKTRYSEKEARNACRCILSGLNYMHKRKVTHRDLKPENLLLVSKDDDTTIKLADFGFARRLESENDCRTLCGTPGYMAPEILERWPSYGLTCDIWSVGVILFLLIGGYLPFDDDDQDEVYEKTRNGTFTYYKEYFGDASDEVKDLIGGMLTLNTARRLTAAQALDSKWMKQGDDDLDKRNLTRNLSKMSESFRHQKKVQGAITSVMTANRLERLNSEFSHYLEKKGRQESLFSRTSVITKGAIIQDDDSLTGQPFKTFYEVGKLLGEGGFAEVHHVVHKKTRKEYAAKAITLSGLDDGGLEALKHEINSLKLLRNGPHIVRLYDVFEEGEHTYLVLELMKGGELLQRIVDKEVYTEREARQVCKILFEAVDYMHKKQIAHRDLKPENLLLVERNNDTSVKIADFGFAKRVPSKKGLSTFCGTAEYVAPEVLNLKVTGYDEKCDMWSLGVIVFVLLGGYMPFEGELEELAPKILDGYFEFDDATWHGISASAKELIGSLLKVNPDVRFSAEEALQSDWMTVAGATLARRDLSVAQRKISSKFPIHKLKGAVRAVMASNKLSDLMEIPEEPEIETSDDERDEKKVEDSSSGKRFDQLYDWGKKLGEGSFSLVHESVERQTNKTFAVKRVSRKFMDEGDAIALQDEITSLKAVKGNPHICELHDVFEDPEHTYLVMEIFRGGNLFQRIIQKPHYDEEEARTVCMSLLKGVQHMHKMDIAHRNLKPDNVMLMSLDSDTDLKICDFGFAKKVLYPNALRTQCGTEGYVAPEVLAHHPAYDCQCDMWSLGVVFYILLGGYRPFRGTGDVLMRQIRYGEYEFHKKYWDHVSDEVMDLISSLLTVDPSKRATATEALGGKWMAMENEGLKRHSLETNLAVLKDNFNAKAKLRGAVKTIILSQKLHSLGEHF